jgi:hypothetical protein
MNRDLDQERRALMLAATLVVAVAGGALAQDARNLTVEQVAFDVVQAPAGSPTTNPLHVTAWVDHPDNTYADGERVRLFVQTNKDAYVTVLNVDPDGTTTMLFPNRGADNRVRANTVTEIPDPASEASVTVTGTTGAELIKVIASTRPVALFDAAQLASAGSFQTLRTRGEETARNLAVVMESQGSAEWDVYDKVIQTVAQRPVQGPAAVAAPVAGAAWPSQPFDLQIAADKPLYRTADPVTLMVKTGADCHLTLLNTGPGGESRLLFPNRYQQQTLIRAGQTVVVPGIGDGVSIVPIGPAGVESVVAVCRMGESSVIAPPADFRSGAFRSLDDAGSTARNLAVVADQPVGEQTAIASATFIVIR